MIGLSTLDDAVALARTDRDDKLTQAIQLFSTYQLASKGSPVYAMSKEGQDTLSQIFILAPQHLSARLLLELGQGKARKVLTPAASKFYIADATQAMFPFLKPKGKKAPAPVLAPVTATALTSLQKLRLIADPSDTPLIDAFAHYTEAYRAQQQATGAKSTLDAEKLAVSNEMAKEQITLADLEKEITNGM